jgi:hypothetical protein
MDEWWQQEKYILVIGIFQYGIISIISLLLNSNLFKVSNPTVMKSLTQDPSNAMPEQISPTIANQLRHPTSAPDSKANGEVNIVVDSDLTAIAVNSSSNVQRESLALDVNTSKIEVGVSYSIEISPELFKELLEISNNPAATVDEAIRWWLRRRTLDTLKPVDDRRDRSGMRSHQSRKFLENSWND